MTTSATIVNRLGVMKWSDLNLPCSDVTTNFGHDLPEASVPYEDGVWHDWTGRKPYTIAATLHFVNTIQMSGLESDTPRPLYPDQYSHFMWLAQSGCAQRLVHPDVVFGEIWARVQEGSVRLEATNTAGVIVGVTFVETNVEKPKKLRLLSTGVLKPQMYKAVDPGPAAGHRLAVASSKFKLPNYTGVVSGDIFDLVGQLEGILTMVGNRLTGSLNQWMGRVKWVRDRLDPDTNPLAIAANDILDAYEDAAQTELEFKATTSRPRSAYLLARAMTHDEVAQQKNNTVDEIFELNPTTLRYQVIPKGTRVSYYTD